MTLKNEDGFQIVDWKEWGQFLVIETRRIEECLRYLRENHMSRIRLSSYHGYEAKDLGALTALDFIDGFSTPDDLDLTELRRFRKLKVLGLPENTKEVVDLSWFPELQRCAVTYSRRLHGLPTCTNLRELTLTDYGSTSKNLSEFPELPALEKLTLIKSTIQSFSGIGKLSALHHLETSLMYKLVSVAGLKESRDTLEVVILENCKRLQDHAEIGQLIGLKKLILGDCGQATSISFIGGLRSLEFFSFVGTNVLDGDLSPCIEHPTLKYVGFDNKRDYSHKLSDVRRLVEERNGPSNA